jgi:thioredoxin reductase (NADPH)
MFTTDELKQSKLLSVLGETEILRFAEKAADVRLAPGEWLIREGEPPWFFILFEGRLRIVKELLGRPQDIKGFEYQVGDFFGETPILLGTQALSSLRRNLLPLRAPRPAGVPEPDQGFKGSQRHDSANHE